MVTNAKQNAAKAPAIQTVLDVDHPRFSIPFRLVIEGRRYEGVEISLTEIVAMGLSDRSDANSRPATIQFPFSNFNVDVTANVDRLESHTDTGLTRFAFSDPLGTQRIPMQSVFNAYIAGEMTQIPGLIGGTAASNIQVATPKQSLARRSGKTFSRFLKGLFFGVLGLGLAAYVGSRIYERAFMLRPIGASTIAADTITINAQKTGPIVAFNKEASIGQPLFGVLGDGNSIVSANMPCACEIVKQFVEKGAVAVAGSPVVELLPTGAKTYLATTVDADTYSAVAQGATITVTLADGGVLPVLFGSATAAPSGGTIALKLSPATPIASGQLGEIVSIRIDRFPVLKAALLSLFAPLKG
jgi:hypothetical protein